MTIRHAGLSAMVFLLLGVGLPVAAQLDPTFLGAFSEPFTTFAVTGQLAYPGELDWYAFELVGEDSTLFISARGDGESAGLRALLFDAEDAYVDATESGILRATLAAGTYRVRVDSVESAVQSYSLTMSNGLELESNEGILEANALGELHGPVLVLASLVPAGDADFFRFEIPAEGLPGNSNAVLLSTSGSLAGDTAMILYRYDDSSGLYVPTAFDDDSGDGYWSRLLLRPHPGDRYAVRVEETLFPLDGISDYQLSISPLALRADEEPNNTSATATTLAPTTPTANTWEAAGLLDADDPVDFFALIIQSSVLIQINTEPQPGLGDFDTKLTLYTPSGDRLSQNDDGGDATWSRIVVQLDPGEYFAAVEMVGRGASLLPYLLSVVAQQATIVSETEPNDADSTAEPVSWGPGEALLIEAAIGPEADVDSFRFMLDVESTVVFETGPRAGSTEEFDTTLAVYDEDLWEIASNDDWNGSWSRIEETLPAGTYYVVVESFYGDTSFDYTLLITESGAGH